MAIRSQSDMLDAVRAKLGDDTSDDALQLIEDLTDTFGSLSGTDGSGVNWHDRYNENDAAWRKKYRDRFFQTDAKTEDPIPEPEAKNPRSYKDLFK